MTIVKLCFSKKIFKILVACIFIASCGSEHDVAPPEAIRSSKTPDGGHSPDGQPQNAKKHGACDTKDEVIFRDNPQFSFHARKCGYDEHSVWISGSEHSSRTANCIRKTHKNLKIACGACFGDAARCGAANCKSECLWDYTSTACAACGRAHCSEAWERCSGSPIKLLADPD